MAHAWSRLLHEQLPSDVDRKKAHTRLTFLNKILGDLAFDSFFPQFTAAELSRILTVSRAFHDAIVRYRRHIHDIDNLLLMFFTRSEIDLFRAIQTFDGFLISGSIALQYFAYTVWRESDLDLYSYPRHFERIVDLLDAIGFTYVPRNGCPTELQAVMSILRRQTDLDASYGSTEALSAVLTFVRVQDGVLRKVQVMVCKRSPIEAILNFHSTVVMNFIGPTHAVCLYPYSTLHRFESIRLVASDKGAAAWRKYVNRGWVFRGSGSALCGLRRASEWYRDRAIGDPATWIIALHGIGISDDPECWQLKWYLAHSWTHVTDALGCVRLYARVGGRCSWPWLLTFASGSEHLRLHGAPLPANCEVCAEEIFDIDKIYPLVHVAVNSSGRITDTEIDRFMVNYLYSVFSSLPLPETVESLVLPDANVSLCAFIQLRALLIYCRVEPKVSLTFHCGSDSRIVTTAHVYVASTGEALAETVAVLQCSKTRRPKIDNGFVFKILTHNGTTLLIDVRSFVMPSYCTAYIDSDSQPELPDDYVQTIEHFIDNTIQLLPRRPAAIGEVVPQSEAKKGLREGLNGFFVLFKCPPRLLAQYSDRGHRNDIHALTEINIQLPETWPDLEDTMFALVYNSAAVLKLHRLGFSVAITKGGRLFI